MLLKEPQSRFEEYYRIYEESFPSKERRTREQQRDILSHPCHRVRIKEEDGSMLAFVSYWELPGCLFLEHLAHGAVQGKRVWKAAGGGMPCRDGQTRVSGD